MNETDALSQFITDTKGRCPLCMMNLNLGGGRYYHWDEEKPKTEICERCFDGDIKKRWGYF